jgi:hypothetical protein
MDKNKFRKMLGIVTLFSLSIVAACVENTGLENIGEPCFTKESLETVPWIIDELKPYQDPRMMGYHAAVYIYNAQQFLAITHPFDCSPLGHVFNCAGVPLDSLGIDIKDFENNRKLAAVLATVKF